ncbi:MAG: type IV pilin N-terminal domain-containing protein [Methanomicrobiales archaeon]|nr:type IV pilin N-terminal domain-containing protein [Methanomicrobiales archaeon]
MSLTILKQFNPVVPDAGVTMREIDSEEAVSETVGIILAVAITVMLAAWVAANVYGTAEKTKNTYLVSASAYDDGIGNIVVTYQGGQDHDKLVRLDVWILNGENQPDNWTWAPPEIGVTRKSNVPPTQKPDRIYIVATFIDGTEILIMDKYV